MSANELRFDGHRSVGVLLLHGLTGTPAEMRVLGEALAADGYGVHAPLLPGRGTRQQDMHALCWEDWMAAALQAYDALAERHESVVVGGVSAGGTMALDVALRRRPAALLLYATALAIRDRIAYVTPYIWRVVRSWPSPQSDCVEAETRTPCYDRAPLRAVSELIGGIRRVRSRLEEIQAPALVAHAVTDRFVPVACSYELSRRLRGPVRTLFLEGTGHGITADAKRHEVASVSQAFLAERFGARRRDAELGSA